MRKSTSTLVCILAFASYISCSNVLNTESDKPPEANQSNAQKLNQTTLVGTLDFLIYQNTVGAAAPGAMEPLASGGFVIAFEENAVSFIRIYDSNANPVTDNIQVAGLEYVMWDQDLAVISNGNIVVIRESLSKLYCRIFDSNGNALTDVKEVAPTNISWEHCDIRVASMTGGEFITTWLFYKDTGESTSYDADIMAAIYDNNGAIVTKPFQINATAGYRHVHFSSFGLYNGGIVVAGSNQSDSNNIGA